MTSRCRSCKADVVWAETASGSRMPVDADPHPDGNVRLLPGRGDRGETLARVITADELTIDLEGETLHRSHFVTCPDADSWRSPTRRDP